MFNFDLEVITFLITNVICCNSLTDRFIRIERFYVAQTKYKNDRFHQSKLSER